MYEYKHLLLLSYFSLSLLFQLRNFRNRQAVLFRNEIKCVIFIVPNNYVLVIGNNKNHTQSHIGTSNTPSRHVPIQK